MDLSLGDLVEISGLPEGTVDRWCRIGVIEYVASGRGGGHHRRFSLSTAVALAFAAEWRDWGAGLPLLRPLIRNIAGMPMKKMTREFRAGRTHMMKLPDGPLVEMKAPAGFPVDLDEVGVPGIRVDQFDLSRVYREVMEKIETIKSRDAHVMGRNRGLLTSVN